MMRVVLEIKCSRGGKVSTTRAVLKGPHASDAPLGMTPTEAISGGIAPIEAPPSKEAIQASKTSSKTPSKEATATETTATSTSPVLGVAAANYLQEHNIMSFVESMVRTLAHERPADPWSRVSAMLPDDVRPQVMAAIEAAQGQ